MAGLQQINRMRESIVEEIARGFSPQHQAEAFGLLAQGRRDRAPTRGVGAKLPGSVGCVIRVP